MGMNAKEWVTGLNYLIYTNDLANLRLMVHNPIFLITIKETLKGGRDSLGRFSLTKFYFSSDMQI